MFEFGRDVRRFFAGRRAGAAAAASEAALLELLETDALRAEARAVSAAAQRAAPRERARRKLSSARIWRELARRTGDGEALRKAAAAAAEAKTGFAGARRQQDWAQARLEEAHCAITALELFGDASLAAGAEKAAAEAQRAGGPGGLVALGILAQVRARGVLLSGGPAEARAAARSFNDPIALLETAAERDPRLKLAAVEIRLVRAELMLSAGMRLKDEDLVRAAISDLAAAHGRLDPAYEPLTSARISVAKAAAKAALAETIGDLTRLSRAVTALTNALQSLSRQQSPTDWARGHVLLARALAALGEATDKDVAFKKALASYDRATLAVKSAPGLQLRAEAANGRGQALARLAELTGDLKVLDAAEAAFKAELKAQARQPEPVAWALLQVQLGQVYATRLALRRRDRGERAAAAIAFQAALEVFGEEGLRSLAALASDGLERLAAVKVG